MLGFEHWELAVKTRNTILSLSDASCIQKEIEDALVKLNETDSSKEKKIDFLKHLSSLFLTIAVNNDALPKSITNPDQAIENAREARNILKPMLRDTLLF